MRAAIDLSRVPDDVIIAEAGKRRNAMRQTKTGGRNGGRLALPRCAHCAAIVRDPAEHVCVKRGA